MNKLLIEAFEILCRLCSRVTTFASRTSPLPSYRSRYLFEPERWPQSRRPVVSAAGLFIILLMSLIPLITPLPVFAEESIKSFDTKIVAHQNGDMTITETIQYDFGDDYRHGIFRFIPTFTQVGDLYRISEIEFTDIKREDKKEPYDATYNAAKVEVKIGDPDKTISGINTYQITYIVKNGIGSNFEDHDEIYWDMTGNDWPVPIETASATITTDFNALPTKSICFTGEVSSKETNCTSAISGSDSQTRTSMVLATYQGLTVVTAFPVGTFPKSNLSKDPPRFGKDLLTLIGLYSLVWIILNTVVFAIILNWYLKKRSKIKYGKPAVNFDIPKVNGRTVTPMEAGIIDNTKLEQDDVMATLFDLAIKKYIKIEQIKGKKTLGVFGGKDDYKIIRLKPLEDDKNLNQFEIKLLDAILGGENEKKLSEVKSFYLDFARLEETSFEILVKNSFYTKNPKSQKSMLLILGLIGVASLNIFFGGILIYLSTKLNGRTQTGDRLDWEIEGLKIFLKNLKRHYNFQVKNAITVEKYIPYAMALGHIDEFMDQLKEIDPDYHPNWYSGSSNFYAARAAMFSTMHSNFTTSAPSSSSGFSGGGSSGGGGGGGGGRSW